MEEREKLAAIVSAAYPAGNAPPALTALTDSNEVSPAALLSILEALTAHPPNNSVSHTLELFATNPFNLDLSQFGMFQPDAVAPNSILQTRSGRMPHTPAMLDLSDNLFNDYLNVDWPEEDEEADPDFRVDDIIVGDPVAPMVPPEPKSKKRTRSSMLQEEILEKRPKPTTEKSFSSIVPAPAQNTKITPKDLADLSNIDIQEGRAEKRKENNRRWAKESRERKKKAELEFSSRVKEFEGENRQLKERIVELERQLHASEESLVSAVRKAQQLQEHINNHTCHGSRSRRAPHTSDTELQHSEANQELSSEEDSLSDTSEDSDEEVAEEVGDDISEDGEDPRRVDFEKAMSGISAEGLAELTKLLAWARAQDHWSNHSPNKHKSSKPNILVPRKR